MAEKGLSPKKRERFIRFTRPSAGSSGGGGGGGAASPARAPRRGPSSSPPRSPSRAPRRGPYSSSPCSPSRARRRREPSSSPPCSPSRARRRVPSSSPPHSPSRARRREPSPSPPRSPSRARRREPSPFPPGSPSRPKPRARSSRSGGGGRAASAPGAAPRRKRSSSSPRSRSTSPRSRSTSPPIPFTYVGSGSAASYSDSKNSKDEKPKNQWGSLFMSDPTFLSSDPQNPPHLIGRQNCEPLSTQEFFSLRHNWQQLLDGKRTYLRPPKNNRVAKTNRDAAAFVTPEPPVPALLIEGPLSHLVDAAAAAGVPTVQQNYKILCEQYVRYRRMRNDGSEFYRAFLLSYLENLGKMQCSQAEVTRLMECMARSRENFCRLQWNDAYFSNPEEFFSSVVSEFEHLVNSVANGLNADELYKISGQEISSSRSEDGMLFGVHIRTHEVDYNRVLDQKINAPLFCKEYVRPFGAGIEVRQMMALSEALGISVHVALVNSTMNNGTVQVKCLDFDPLPESGVSKTSGPLRSIRRYYLSSATDKQSFLPPGNLFSSDRVPLVTILLTRKAIAILYRK